MCRVLRVSRSGFYAWQVRSPSERALSDLVLAGRIALIHAVSDSTYGVPRIHLELRDDGILVSRRRVARLMREGSLEGVSRRRSRRGTTVQSAERAAAPDLVGRRFGAVTGPDQVWWSDITYVPTWQGWLYLAVVVDAWSRRIVGWSMRDDLSAQLVVDAVGMTGLNAVWSSPEALPTRQEILAPATWVSSVHG